MDYNWRWYFQNTKLTPDVDYTWGNLAKDYIFIGYINDEDADYSHTEHRFFYNPDTKEFIYVFSSGCSCWDSSDAIDEWGNRQTFKTRPDFVTFLKNGDYAGHTIPDDLLKQIFNDLDFHFPDKYKNVDESHNFIL